MRSITRSTALFAVFVAACTDNGPTGVTSPVATPAISTSSAVEVGIAGWCKTAFPPPSFPLPPIIQQTDIGTCQISHLGRTALYAKQEINFALGTAVSSNVQFTAANGDVLQATSAGTFTPQGTGVRIEALFTFVGGTGRFASASGEARIEGQVDFTTNTTTFSFVDGWISYTPANRQKKGRKTRWTALPSSG